jgi:hypothetical protein
LCCSAGVYAARSVSLGVGDGPFKVGKSFELSIKNNRDGSIWICTEFQRTILHPPNEAKMPIPVLRVLHKSEKSKPWGELAWGVDYGEIKQAVEIKAKHESAYSVALPQSGYFAFELDFATSKLSSDECRFELERKGVVRSRVIFVSQ